MIFYCSQSAVGGESLFRGGPIKEMTVVVQGTSPQLVTSCSRKNEIKYKTIIMKYGIIHSQITLLKTRQRTLELFWLNVPVGKKNSLLNFQSKPNKPW